MVLFNLEKRRVFLKNFQAGGTARLLLLLLLATLAVAASIVVSIKNFSGKHMQFLYNNSRRIASFGGQAASPSALQVQTNQIRQDKRKRPKVAFSKNWGAASKNLLTLTVVIRYSNLVNA
jgi:hypothetical protein